MFKLCKKMLYGLTAATFLTIAMAPSSLAAELTSITAAEVIYQAESKNNGDTLSADMTMVLINHKGQKRVRRMKTFRKDYGKSMKDEKAVFFFTSPQDIKDTVYLSYDWEDEDVDDDSWLYLPSLKRVKRLAEADKSDAFLGSDFSYTDIRTYKGHFWDYTMVSTSELVDGHECWVVEGLAKKGIEKKVMQETGYTKVHIWVRKDNFMKVAGKFWVKKGKKIKYLKTKNVVEIDGIWTVLVNQMITTKHERVEHTTIIKLDNVVYDKGVDDSFFTPQRMKRGV